MEPLRLLALEPFKETRIAVIFEYLFEYHFEFVVCAGRLHYKKPNFDLQLLGLQNLGRHVDSGGEGKNTEEKAEVSWCRNDNQFPREEI